MKISDDINSLRTHIAVPAGLTRARWAARPQGTVGLGPTDLELVALFPIDESAWDGLSAKLGPAGAPVISQAPADLLSAVGLEGGVPQGATLPCKPYENIRWTCAEALKTDHGVLTWLTSR